MKCNLEYQKTEYDCGCQSYINALLYLYDRQEIPPDFIKIIYQYTLDEYGKDAYHGGTSPYAMGYLTDWFNMYSKVKRFPIACEHLTDYDMSKGSFLHKWILDGGVAILRVHFEGFAHYVLVTSVDDEYAYIFDSYVDTVDNFGSYNKRVRLDEMNNAIEQNYYIGNIDFQNAFLIKRAV